MTLQQLIRQLDLLRFGCQQLAACRTADQFRAVKRWFQRNIRL